PRSSLAISTLANCSVVLMIQSGAAALGGALSSTPSSVGAGAVGGRGGFLNGGRACGDVHKSALSQVDARIPSTPSTEICGSSPLAAPASSSRASSVVDDATVLLTGCAPRNRRMRGRPNGPVRGSIEM